MAEHPVGTWWRALRRTVAGPDVAPVRLPLDRWPRLAPFARPVGLLVVIGLFAVTLAQQTDRRLPGIVPILFAGLTVAPLLALPRRPLLAWRLAVVALATCTFNAPAGAGWPWTPVLALGSLLVLAVVATRADRPVLVWVGLLTLVPGLALVDPDHRVSVLVLVLTVLVLGDLVRGNRRSRRALAAQTALSERERERRAVLEERTRIARELHDVVAHHMSMIAVQAETAPYRLAAVPDPARAEFAAIAGSARAALTGGAGGGRSTECGGRAPRVYDHPRLRAVDRPLSGPRRPQEVIAVRDSDPPSRGRAERQPR